MNAVKLIKKMEYANCFKLLYVKQINVNNNLKYNIFIFFIFFIISQNTNYYEIKKKCHIAVIYNYMIFIHETF